MALEKVTKVIGETEYEVTQLDAIRGRKVMVRLAKAFAPVLAGGKSADGLARLGEALANISDDDVDFLCDTFAPSTSVISTDAQGRRVAPQLSKIFGLHFAGKYDELIQWLYFCLEVNFGSFVKRLQSQQGVSLEKVSE